MNTKLIQNRKAPGSGFTGIIKTLGIISFLSFFMYACEKEITVDLPTPTPKIVVEGAIEQGCYPWVILTRNAPYFEPVDSSTLVNMIITNAVVTVSDGQVIDTLSIGFDPYVYPYVKYIGQTIIGEVGKTYNLTIQVDGKTYTAQTSIPNPVHLDSVKFKIETGYDTLGVAWIYLVDPDTIGNHYRIFTKVLGRDSVFLHPYPSTTDDRFFNGQFAEYSVYRGRNPLEDDMYDDENLDSAGIPRWLFIKDETVVIKLTSIDEMHYDFWYSVEQQYMTDGNPFASPISARTNISGDALGIWGGYGVAYDTLHCTIE